MICSLCESRLILKVEAWNIDRQTNTRKEPCGAAWYQGTKQQRRRRRWKLTHCGNTVKICVSTGAPAVWSYTIAERHWTPVPGLSDQVWSGSCYWQIQGEMMVTGTSWCDLFVFSGKDLLVQHIHRGSAMIHPMKKKFHFSVITCQVLFQSNVWEPCNTLHVVPSDA